MDNKENINFIFKLDNKNRSGNFFFLFIASGVIASGIGIAFAAVGMYKAIVVDVILATIYFYFITRINPSFFEMLVSEDKIQLNFYSVSSTFRNYKTIEIPFNQFHDFKIEEKYGKLRKTLTVSVKSKYGIADYPPISISILKRTEIAQVAHVLQQIMKTHVK